MKVKRLNLRGLEEFKKLLRDFKFNQLTGDIPVELLQSAQFTEEMEEELIIEAQIFPDKLSAAKYLTDRLNLNENKKLYYDVGLWSWISIFYFDQLAPKGRDQRRSPGEEARHLLQDPKNHQKYYRHLLAGPSRIYSELGELGRIFLAGTLDKRGDLTEQLQAYQNIALNKGIISVADEFYWDKSKNKPKRGSGSKGKGTPRRFVKIVSQFELTYDLNSMDGGKIIELFPKSEFQSWLSKAD